MTTHSPLRSVLPKPEANAMKHLTRLLPVLALLVGAAIVERAEAANTTLTVNCTFTISKDVNIVWTGTGAVGTAITTAGGNTSTLTWPIGAASLNTSYSTIGTTNGWVAAVTDTLKITNSSLTTDPVDLSLVASSAGWTAAATTGTIDQFVAACTANDTPPANTAAVLAAAGAVVTNPTPAVNSFANNLAGNASTQALWFAITVPSSISTHFGSKTIAFVFTGTAH